MPRIRMQESFENSFNNLEKTGNPKQDRARLKKITKSFVKNGSLLLNALPEDRKQEFIEKFGSNPSKKQAKIYYQEFKACLAEVIVSVQGVDTSLDLDSQTFIEPIDHAPSPLYTALKKAWFMKPRSIKTNELTMAEGKVLIVPQTPLVVEEALAPTFKLGEQAINTADLAGTVSAGVKLKTFREHFNASNRAVGPFIFNEQTDVTNWIRIPAGQAFTFSAGTILPAGFIITGSPDEHENQPFSGILEPADDQNESRFTQAYTFEQNTTLNIATRTLLKCPDEQCIHFAAGSQFPDGTWMETPPSIKFTLGRTTKLERGDLLDETTFPVNSKIVFKQGSVLEDGTIFTFGDEEGEDDDPVTIKVIIKSGLFPKYLTITSGEPLTETVTLAQPWVLEAAENQTPLKIHEGRVQLAKNSVLPAGTTCANAILEAKQANRAQAEWLEQDRAAFLTYMMVFENNYLSETARNSTQTEPQIDAETMPTYASDDTLACNALQNYRNFWRQRLWDILGSTATYPYALACGGTAALAVKSTITASVALTFGSTIAWAIAVPLALAVLYLGIRYRKGDHHNFLAGLLLAAVILCAPASATFLGPIAFKWFVFSVALSATAYMNNYFSEAVIKAVLNLLMGGSDESLFRYRVKSGELKTLPLPYKITMGMIFFLCLTVAVTFFCITLGQFSPMLTTVYLAMLAQAATMPLLAQFAIPILGVLGAITAVLLAATFMIMFALMLLEFRGLLIDFKEMGFAQALFSFQSIKGKSPLRIKIERVFWIIGMVLGAPLSAFALFSYGLAGYTALKDTVLITLFHVPHAAAALTAFLISGACAFIAQIPFVARTFSRGVQITIGLIYDATLTILSMIPGTGVTTDNTKRPAISLWLGANINMNAGNNSYLAMLGVIATSTAHGTMKAFKIAVAGVGGFFNSAFVFTVVLQLIEKLASSNSNKSAREASSFKQDIKAYCRKPVEGELEGEAIWGLKVQRFNANTAPEDFANAFSAQDDDSEAEDATPDGASPQ